MRPYRRPPPPFSPKPAKITPRDAYSVIVGDLVVIAGQTGDEAGRVAVRRDGVQDLGGAGADDEAQLLIRRVGWRRRGVGPRDWGRREAGTGSGTEPSVEAYV